jgi:pantetheine-phosphate adenylyltransferase
VPQSHLPSHPTSLTLRIPAKAHGKRIAIFPGTFDPLTLGHIDVIHRGRRLFDQLIVAIGQNPGKSELFSVADRLKMIRTEVKGYHNVVVEAYEGLTMELVKRRGAIAILRGLRNMSDLEYEFQIALTNRKVAGIETVFIMTSEEYGFTSSSLIKQIMAMGGNAQQLASLLPLTVIQGLSHHFKDPTKLFGTHPHDELKS